MISRKPARSGHNRSLRILQANATPAGAVGGLEAVVDMLARGLRERGHVVHQAFLGRSTAARGPYMWTMFLPPPTTWHKLPTPRSAVSIIKGYLELARIFYRIKPDFVHFNYVTWETTYFIIVCFLLRIRIVLTVHGSDLLRTKWPLARAVLPYILRHADSVTVVSEELAECVLSLQQGHGDRPHIIKNGIDTSFWTPCKIDTPERIGRRTLVSVGRLEIVKGHDVLIRSLALVKSAGFDIRLVLIGDGSQRSELERLASSLGLNIGAGNDIEFTGSLEPTSILAYLRSSDIFVLPSRSEGLPLALLEALSTGLPVVASCVGGVPEVLSVGGGIMVPEGDPQALAESLESLISRPEQLKSLREDASRRSQDFSLERTLDAYERVLAGACINRHSP